MRVANLLRKQYDIIKKETLSTQLSRKCYKDLFIVLISVTDNYAL